MTNLETFVNNIYTTDDIYTTDKTRLKFRLRDLILLKLAHQNTCVFTYEGKKYSVGCVDNNNPESWYLYIDDVVYCYSITFNDVLDTLVGYISGRLDW